MTAQVQTTAEPPLDIAEALHQLPDIAFKLLYVLIAVVIGLLLLRWGRKLICYACGKRKINSKTEKRTTETAQSLLLSLYSYFMYFLIAVIALYAFGVNVSGILQVAGISGLIIGFGAQTLIKDIISGMFLWLEGRLAIGDVVTVAGQTGTVINMTLRTTVLRSVNGNLYAVPNGDIRTVVNMSRENRCAQVDVTVAFGQDFQAALHSVQDECKKIAENGLTEQTPEVLGYIASDFRGATMRIQCKCDAEQVWSVERTIRLAVLARLESEKIKP